MSHKVFFNYFLSLSEYEIIGGNYYRSNKDIRASNMKYGEVNYNLQRLKFNKPPQQPSEQYFNKINRFNYNPNSNYIQREIYKKYPIAEFSRNVIVPDDSRQLEFRNAPYTASNNFYNAKSYESNRETNNRADSDMQQLFPSHFEKGKFVIG